LLNGKPAESRDHRGESHVPNATGSLLFQAVLTILLLVVTLKLWRTDVRVPMY
jgi:hypothetical protein